MTNTRRIVIIPEKVIPRHSIERCEDCPDFENRGGSWGEYHACRGDHNWESSDIDRHGKDIPDNCPRLAGEIK